jgi:hypothetical protein
MERKEVATHFHLINAQLIQVRRVNSYKRSRLGACTHLHQATSFIATADLRFGHADILYMITQESAYPLAISER